MINVIVQLMFIFYVVYVCISQTRIFSERVVERSTCGKMCFGLNMMSMLFVILSQVTSAFHFSVKRFFTETKTILLDNRMSNGLDIESSPTWIFVIKNASFSQPNLWNRGCIQANGRMFES